MKTFFADCLSKGLKGLAALLLAAAAIALLVFSLATLLGVAAVFGLIAAGVLLGAPADSKALVREAMAAVSGWMCDFERIVANAGEMFLSVLNRFGGAPADASAAMDQAAQASKATQSAEADDVRAPSPSPHAAEAAPAQDAADAPRQMPRP